MAWAHRGREWADSVTGALVWCSLVDRNPNVAAKRWRARSERLAVMRIHAALLVIYIERETALRRRITTSYAVSLRSKRAQGAHAAVEVF
jgi:hypothetical protein